ncbi:MAG: ATP phosphoribosyltransferase regulatory subunit [Clostridiales bacterium]|nr:ATP phosphoribosyltransferase regulatory subunit [Clostridiales bacterium]
MSDWKLHTPEGVNDILPAQCARKKEIESTMWSVFSSIGYKEIEVPSFEYYDCYAGGEGTIAQESLFKFFDNEGRILALRPEFTTSIARMAATKLADKTMPLRFLYTGNVFRLEEQCEGARQREFTQCGIELIGSYAPAADAEVIAAAMEAILASGIEEFSMEIGQVAFFNGLVEQAGLDEVMTEKLRERIDLKDTVGIKAITDKLSIDEGVKKLMIELPYMFGDLSVLERAYVSGLNETSKLALDNLKSIYTMLADYGFEQYISIDLGMLQSIDYYTGTIFKGYTRGVGFPICAGGRYDNLMGKFGAPKGAVGVAIGVNRIMTALGHESADGVSASLIFAEKGARAIAYELAYNLRVNGCLVEYYIGEGDFTDAEKYSHAADIGCMLRVFADGKLMIKDFTADEITQTTVQDFLGYYAEDDEHECDHEHGCDCGHHH